MLSSCGRKREPTIKEGRKEGRKEGKKEGRQIERGAPERGH